MHGVGATRDGIPQALLSAAPKIVPAPSPALHTRFFRRGRLTLGGPGGLIPRLSVALPRAATRQHFVRLALPQQVKSASSAQVAQLVEQRTENPRVGGSIPPLGTILKENSAVVRYKLLADRTYVIFFSVHVPKQRTVQPIGKPQL